MRTMNSRLLAVALLLVALVMLPVFALAATHSVATYAEFEAAFAAAQDGDTIKLTADIEDGKGIKIKANRFKTQGLTIDLNGKTYTFKSNAVGSTGTTTLGIQLLKGNKLTIKNGTIDSISGSGIKRLIQSYGDLTLIDVELDGSNLDKHADNTANITVTASNASLKVQGDTSISKADNSNGGIGLAVSNWSDYYPNGVSATVDTTGTIEGMEVSNDGEARATADKIDVVIKNVDLVGKLTFDLGNDVTPAKAAQVEGGVFDNAPDASVIKSGLTQISVKSGSDTDYVIGTKDSASQTAAEMATAGSTVTVLSGSANLTDLPYNVTIANKGNGTVSANGTKVEKDSNITLKAPSIPKTGDESNLLLWTAMLVMGAAVLMMTRKQLGQAK